MTHPEKILDIQNRLHSPEGETWKRALKESTGLDPSVGVGLIIPLFEDPIWLKRKMASETLSKFSTQWVTPILLKEGKSSLDAVKPNTLYWCLQTLAGEESPEILTFFEQIIQSGPSEFVTYVAYSLSRKPSPPKIKKLVQLLNYPTYEVKKGSLEILKGLGPEVTPHIEHLLKVENLESFVQGLEIYTLALKEKSLPILSEIYHSGTQEKKFFILDRLARISQPDITRFLIGSLKDPDWYIRKKGEHFLITAGMSSVDPLLEHFKTLSPEGRTQVLAILAQILGEKFLPLLNRMTKSGNIENQLLVLETLPLLKCTGTGEILLNLLSHESPFIRETAITTLPFLKDLDLSLLFSHYQNLSEEHRVPILRAIGQMGSISVDFFLKLLQNAERGEILFLLNVFTGIKPQENLVLKVIQLLGHRDWPIRHQASESLFKWGVAIFPLLLTGITGESEDQQFWIQKVLNRLGDPLLVYLDKNFQGLLSQFGLAPLFFSLVMLEDPRAMSLLQKNLDGLENDHFNTLFEKSLPIFSPQLAENLLNLLGGGEERLTKLAIHFLKSCQKESVRRGVFNGLNQKNVKMRANCLVIIKGFENLSQGQLNNLAKFLQIEDNQENILLALEILVPHPNHFWLTLVEKTLENAGPRFRLNILEKMSVCPGVEIKEFIGKQIINQRGTLENSHQEPLYNILRNLFSTDQPGLIGLIQEQNPEISSLALKTLRNLHTPRFVESVIPRLGLLAHKEMLKEAVYYLSSFLNEEDFRIKNLVTNCLLSMGNSICPLLIDHMKSLANPLDRKAVGDIVEALGGSYDSTLLNPDGKKREVLSDQQLDDLLEKRKIILEQVRDLESSIVTASTRELTIMFTDIAGYTSKSHDSSLLDVMSFLREHDTLLVPLVEKNGGKIIKFLGDAILAVFEDPNKAVLGSIQIQKALLKHNLTASDPDKLEVRIALNTGPVILKEHDVLGDAVNITARIEGVAEPREIVISKNTRDALTPETFDITFYRDFQAKGIQEALELFLVNY